MDLRARPRLVGVEHEYRVSGADGGQLDMRTIIDDLAIEGARGDPGDPHAIRCLHGSVITADGREAEIATPPLLCAPGVLGRLTAHIAAAHSDLCRALDPDNHVEGYSTHLNVQTSDRTSLRTALRLAQRWSPSLMLLSHDRHSPGLLVRPRWQRMEFGCEFLPRRQRDPALAFAVAAVAATEGRLGGRGLAPLHVAIEPSRRRYGWYVDRRAFGGDLLESGRSSRLRTSSGRTLTAQDHLEATWATARPHVASHFEVTTVDTLDAIVDGHTPLPCEAPWDRSIPDTDVDPSDAEIGRWPLTYSLSGYTVRPTTLTWRTCVFEIEGPTRPRWITVPGHQCLVFLESLHGGRFDNELRSGRGHLRLELGRPDGSPFSDGFRR